MTFDSTTFLIFFVVVLAVHRLPIPWSWRKLNLLLASYLFYAAWNPPFVLLIWLSTVVDWFLASLIHRAVGRARKRVLLVASLGVNLGLLGYFKYGGLAVETFSAAAQGLGFEYHAAAPSIFLPVGISFYTFQTLSYTLDVYLGRTRPSQSFLDYALYVTFFPQLVAGPIVRSTDFLPQCKVPKETHASSLGYGLALIVLGLFLKVVLADAFMAPISDALYSSKDLPGFVDAWIGTFAFTVQIYCDFAGYSLCAIGVACCLGFWLPVNFDSPYAALGFSDFWRRWHVSLSSWLRDYLYIPLGGNRYGITRTQVNLMITMLLGGLWHGASWTFVVWGALHGGYLVAERGLRATIGHFAIWTHPVGRALVWTTTFAGVCLAWVFFRAETFSQAVAVSAAMMGMRTSPDDPLLSHSDMWIVLTVLVGILAGAIGTRRSSLQVVVERAPRWSTALALAMMLVAIVHAGGEDRAFIYFQF